MSEKEKLIDKLKSRTPLYSTLDISYQQEYSGPYRDLSLRTDDCLVIIAEKDGKLSGFGRPAVSVGNQKIARQYVYDLLKEYKDIWYMGFEVDGVSRLCMENGYKYRPYFTQIIDLTKTEEELYTDLRKSYKQLVKEKHAYSSDMQYSGNKMGGYYEVFERFRFKHRCMHGITRNDNTWNLQYQMQPLITYDYVCKSGAMFYYNPYSAYYASFVADDKENGHSVIWCGILRLKSLGVKTLEMGEQVFSGDQKEMNISKFKRGFGGNCEMRLMIGEK